MFASLLTLLTSAPLLLRFCFVRFQARQPALLNLLTRATLELRRPRVCTRHLFVSPYLTDLLPLKIKPIYRIADNRDNRQYSAKSAIDYIAPMSFSQLKLDYKGYLSVFVI